MVSGHGGVTLAELRKVASGRRRLRLRAGIEEIAGLAAEAAETSLQAAASDPAFLHSFWLLTQLPHAARGPAFAEDLGHLGIDVTGPPSRIRVEPISGSRSLRTRERRTDLTWARWPRWRRSRA